MPDRIPVDVLTGFLGSGKTTLLRQLLAAPAFADTAVLINEFGEIGLDHLLVESVTDGVVLLKSGCVCCTIRADLAASIRDLHGRRQRGEIPAFRRLVIETTGLADPMPVAATVMHEPVIRHHFRLGHIVTTVDAVNGTSTFAAHDESVKQAAMADRLVLTKADLADDATLAALRATLARLNPAATMVDAAFGAVDPIQLLDASSGVGHVEVACLPDGHAHQHAHMDGIASFVLAADEPVEWGAFAVWLTMLLNRHGDRILRVKGLLDVAGSDRPVVVNGVQNLVHAPEHLASWPDGVRATRLVFIAKGMDAEAVRRSFRAFQNLAV